MKLRRFGKTELRVSEVGLGALEMGAQYGLGEDAARVPSEDEAIALLRDALDAGVTLFDTAGVYGLSEARIGKFLRAERPATRPVLTSKLMVTPGEGAEAGKWIDYATRHPFPTVKACVDHQVRRCLHNLGVEALDVMQLHGVPEADEPLAAMTEALTEHVRAGRIRFLGASCGGGQIDRLLKAGDYRTVQLAYNLLDQGERKKGLELARRHDLGVLIRIPLALGVLAGRTEHLSPERRQRFEPFLEDLRGRLPRGMSVPEAALRFLLTSPEISSVLVGTRRSKHLRENAAAGDGRGLSPELFSHLTGVADRGELPQWSWGDHYQNDWPKGADEANLKLCRSVDVA